MAIQYIYPDNETEYDYDGLGPFTGDPFPVLFNTGFNCEWTFGDFDHLFVIPEFYDRTTKATVEPVTTGSGIFLFVDATVSGIYGISSKARNTQDNIDEYGLPLPYGTPEIVWQKSNAGNFHGFENNGARQTYQFALGISYIYILDGNDGVVFDLFGQDPTQIDYETILGALDKTKVNNLEFNITDRDPYSFQIHDAYFRMSGELSSFNTIPVPLSIYNSQPINSGIPLALSGIGKENNNIDLITYSPKPSDSLDLYTGSHLTANADPTGVPLLIDGHGSNFDSLFLSLVGGIESASLNLTLPGYNRRFNDSIDLYMEGIPSLSGDENSGFDLYTHGAFLDNSYMNLTVYGGGIGSFSNPENNIPLFLSENHQSGELNLFIHSGRWKANSSGVDCYILGSEGTFFNSQVEVGDLDLSISGAYKSLTDSMNLVMFQDIVGNEVQNVPLSLLSFAEQSGDLDLSIRGGIAAQMNLFVKTLTLPTRESGVDISIKGTENAGLFGTFDLFTGGDNFPSGVLNLTIPGVETPDQATRKMNLFLKGTGNLDGSLNNSASMDFMIANNWELNSSGVDLFMPTPDGDQGVVPTNGLMNLYLNRDVEGITHSAPLIVAGPSGVTDAVDLYLNGLPNHRDNITLLISGVESMNDNIRFYLNGF